MSPLLEQFLAEAREFLQGISDQLLRLEHEPDNQEVMNELFRLVHTLKGNSGLFDFPDMTRVLHAGEDLLSAVREGRVGYSEKLADHLLDAMDFVERLCAEIEKDGRIKPARAGDAVKLAEILRGLLGSAPNEEPAPSAIDTPAATAETQWSPPLTELPEPVRMEAFRRASEGHSLFWVSYSPVEECFYQGDDPYYTAMQTPHCLWASIRPRAAWPPLVDLDAYRCVLDFQMLSVAAQDELEAHYRYVPDQVRIMAVDPQQLAVIDFEMQDSVERGRREPALPAGSHVLWPAIRAHEARERPVRDNYAACAEIFDAQREILTLQDANEGLSGRLQSVALVLANCCRALGEPADQETLDAALMAALTNEDAAPLQAWLDELQHGRGAVIADTPEIVVRRVEPARDPQDDARDDAAQWPAETATGEATQRFGRRTDDQANTRTIRVEQEKIDQLMNLIGELVVAKNSLPYLARRAEHHYGEREMAREIKDKYSVFERIAEDMQDAIMQVRMMPFSFVSLRFFRLVRDLSRKLGKDVQLVVEGEDTKADKNIIEALGDPLVHIIRNSLDHGFETPEVRSAAGKNPQGTLKIKASQASDRVLIEVIDDGKGIDPEKIKESALAKGLIDQAEFQRLSDREAINLIFLPGFSTAATVSDVSGRGVGMDAVRMTVEKLNGSLSLDSVVGKGTTLRLSLPLSMAVTQVMVIESDSQLFGVPTNQIVETVRVPRESIQSIKHSQTTTLRNRVVPMKPLNELLGLPSEPLTNDDDELAMLVARVGAGEVGLVVDDFKGCIDIIQKPMNGVLSNLGAYTGSALLGDGSVLMVLNLAEIV